MVGCEHVEFRLDVHFFPYLFYYVRSDGVIVAVAGCSTQFVRAICDPRNVLGYEKNISFGEKLSALSGYEVEVILCTSLYEHTRRHRAVGSDGQHTPIYKKVAETLNVFQVATVSFQVM